MNKLKILIVSFVLLLPFCGKAQQQKTLVDSVRMSWVWFDVSQEDVMTKAEILEQKKVNDDYIAKTDKNDKRAILQNNIYALLEFRRYYQQQPEEPVDKELLKSLLEGMDFLSEDFQSLANRNMNIDTYFAIKALVNGKSTSYVFAREDGDFVYEKYKAILESGDMELISDYFRYLESDFILKGYTDALRKSKPLFMQYLPEGELKELVDTMYQIQERLDIGQLAPEFKLQDDQKKEWKLSDFKGKILIIDVWATWCGGCIEKLPYFIKLAERYKTRDDVEFMTISIDNEWSFGKWKDCLSKYKLQTVKNLIAPEEITTFQKDYFVRGVPRYLIIDKDGCFIDSDAPGPVDGLVEIVEKLLK